MTDEPINPNAPATSRSSAGLGDDIRDKHDDEYVNETARSRAREYKPAMKSDCPFCNSHQAWINCEDLSCQYVECNHCGARGPTAGDYEDAWRYWNAIDEAGLKATYGKSPNAPHKRCGD